MKLLLKQFLCISMLTFFSSQSIAADAITKAGQGIIKNYADSIAHIEGTFKVTAKIPGMGSQKHDSTIDTLATIVNSSGLVVTSYSMLDAVYLTPSVEQMGQNGPMTIKLSGEIGEIRIRYADGTKVPAKVVLKDPEMDLAFLMPTEKISAQKGLDKAPSAEADIFEQIIALKQASALAKYQPTLQIGRIAGILKKPQKLYITEDFGAGLPVFSVGGKLLGISLTRGEPQHYTQQGEPEAIPVVLPIKEVMSATKQIK